MNIEELPDWLETLYNVDQSLAEKAEKYIDELIAEKEIIPHKPAAFSKGDKVRITGKECGHVFNIGEEVCIVRYDITDGDYEATNGSHTWCVVESEITKC